LQIGGGRRPECNHPAWLALRHLRHVEVVGVEDGDLIAPDAGEELALFSCDVVESWEAVGVRVFHVEDDADIGLGHPHRPEHLTGSGGGNLEDGETVPGPDPQEVEGDAQAAVLIAIAPEGVAVGGEDPGDRFLRGRLTDASGDANHGSSKEERPPATGGEHDKWLKETEDLCAEGLVEPASDSSQTRSSM